MRSQLRYVNRQCSQNSQRTRDNLTSSIWGTAVRTTESMTLVVLSSHAMCLPRPGWQHHGSKQAKLYGPSADRTDKSPIESLRKCAISLREWQLLSSNSFGGGQLGRKLAHIWNVWRQRLQAMVVEREPPITENGKRAVGIQIT